MERQKFEESLKKAFDQAEVEPTENAWTNIELDLERAKGKRLKRRLVFYQLLAAASVAFAAVVGAWVYVSNRDIINSQPTQLSSVTPPQATTTVSPLTSGTTSDAVPEGIRKSADEKTYSVTKPGNNSSEKLTASGSDNGNSNPVLNPTETALAAVQPQNTSERYDEAVFSPSRHKLPGLVDDKRMQPALIRNEPEPDPVTLMLAKLDKREKEVAEEKGDKKTATDEKLWTSVGFAAGSFSSVNSGTPASTTGASSLFSQSSLANEEVKASGMTYSMGVNIGTKLSERWVFQGGINYLAQSSDYTQKAVLGNSDFTKFRPITVNALDKLAEGDAQPNAVVSTAPHNVNNNVRYLSIPLQAGYLIVNRDIGLQLNAGVSTDLFLQSTVTATLDGETVDKSTEESGDNSAFRQVNLSGLMGTEVSYKFGKHYRIALNPGLRYPFNSIYKSDDYKASRLTFDVGLRFRYIFH